MRTLTDATQAVAQSYAYTSYGVTTMANPGGLDQPFQYTAREWDAPSGLYYYRARYYDPAAGRFLSHDPIRHYGGYNLYAYVEGSAINRVDPSGLWAYCRGWGCSRIACLLTAHNKLQSNLDSCTAIQNKCLKEAHDRYRSCIERGVHSFICVSFLHQDAAICLALGGGCTGAAFAKHLVDVDCCEQEFPA